MSKEKEYQNKQKEYRNKLHIFMEKASKERI